jgi:hypothetical protein
MNKRARNYLVLFTTLVYLAFACLYVVACSENNAHFKFANGGAAISRTDNSPRKTHGYFLSRPRVVRQKLAVALILPVAMLILPFIITGSSIKPTNAPVVPLPVRHRSQIILLRNRRL